MKLISIPIGRSIPINDVGFRVLLIPIVGIMVGWASGLVQADQLSLTQLKLAYAYCIFVAFVIWTGNWYILLFLRSYLDWFERPIKKLIALLLTIPAFTIPVASLLLAGYYKIFQLSPNERIITVTTTAILIAVTFIIHIYETAYTVKEVEQEKLNKANYEKALAVSELNALKSQLDPHFMMNSLNTLSYLIETDKEKAGLFNQNLADIFRYMLQSKERDLVLLAEEFDLLNKYLQLLLIRFTDSIDFSTSIDSKVMEDYLIPSFSLQVLAENAIKHNIFNKRTPMKMEVSIMDHWLVFKNSMSRRTDQKPSTGIGLENLNARCKLLMGNPINILNDFESFEVRIPIKNI